MERAGRSQRGICGDMVSFLIPGVSKGEGIQCMGEQEESQPTRQGPWIFHISQGYIVIWKKQDNRMQAGAQGVMLKRLDHKRKKVREARDGTC